ncbi:MAG: hypothetical protein E7290_10315 [Lachnospiraceae bacterium]|nr:hypothetical protein [Lachnospiraceae bacterium]
MFSEQLKKEQERIHNQVADIEAKLEAMPKGKLICMKNRKWYKWYASYEGGRIYIPSHKRSFAEELAEKRYLMVLLEELKNKQEILVHLGERYAYCSRETEFFLEKNPGICELLRVSQKNLSDELAEWASTKYERSTSYPEHLKFDTYWGEVFRSKSELMIATRLREREIPYRYECALELGNETLYPDFTIRHPRTGKVYYYEHFGKMDDVGYRNRNMSRVELYAKHGIIPGVHLIMSFETQDEPLSLYTIESLLTQYFG